MLISKVIVGDVGLAKMNAVRFRVILIDHKIENMYRLSKAQQTSTKYHFLLSLMNQMLERLASKTFHCFMNCYSGYNQTSINLEDHEKIAFTSLFDVFVYIHMSFILFDVHEKCNYFFYLKKNALKYS